MHMCSWEYDSLSSQLHPDAFMQWLLQSVPLHHLIKCWHSSFLGIPGLINLCRLLPPSSFIKQIPRLFGLHFQFLKVDPLHVVSLLSTYSGFLLESEHISIRLTGNCVLSADVSVNGWFSTWPCIQVFEVVTSRNMGAVNAGEVVFDDEHRTNRMKLKHQLHTLHVTVIL